MKATHPSSDRILAIAPCKRGFGYVMFEEKRGLVDWGVKRMKQRGNLMKCTEVQLLISLYAPDRVVTEAKTKDRSKHIAQLAVRIAREFPELAHRLPGPRKPWEGRNPNAGLLRAAALVLLAVDSVHKKAARDF